MRAWICIYLFGMLFRVQEHGVMMCCIRRVSSVSQPSLLISSIVLVLRRWSFRVNLAALL